MSKVMKASESVKRIRSMVSIFINMRRSHIFPVCTKIYKTGRTEDMDSERANDLRGITGTGWNEALVWHVLFKGKRPEGHKVPVEVRRSYQKLQCILWVSQARAGVRVCTDRGTVRWEVQVVSPTLDHRTGRRARKNSNKGLQPPWHQEGLLRKAEKLIDRMAKLEKITFF